MDSRLHGFYLIGAGNDEETVGHSHCEVEMGFLSLEVGLNSQLSWIFNLTQWAYTILPRANSCFAN